MSEICLNDRICEEKDFSDENSEFNGDFESYKYLKYELTGICINRNLINNNSYKMNSSSITNKSNSLNSISDEEYYKRNEQIDKVNIYDDE